MTREEYDTLTMEQKRQLHRDIWLELAETGADEKISVEVLHDLDLLNDCVCCQEFCDEECAECPIEWGGRKDDDDVPCCREGALYARWVNCEYCEERKKIALEIAEAWH